MPQFNVYVPDDLRDAIRERKDINWSGLFQRIAREQLGAESPAGSMSCRISELEERVKKLEGGDDGSR